MNTLLKIVYIKSTKLYTLNIFFEKLYILNLFSFVNSMKSCVQ